MYKVGSAVSNWWFLMKDKPTKFYINVHKDGNFKSAKITVMNWLRKEKVYPVPNDLYPLVFKIFPTKLEKEVFRNGVKISECHIVDTRVNMISITVK